MTNVMSKLQQRDIMYLDDLLLQDGLVRPVPAADLKALPREHLRIWMHYRGVYGYPTTELVGWLREQIGGRSAIEIGAGTGGFGRALGIPTTDSRMQEREEVRLLYFLQGQPTIQYPDSIIRMDAAEAVQHYRPQVVFGSYITQLGTSGQSNMFGVDEVALIGQVETYLMFGSPTTHGQKQALQLPHKVVREDWMVSRSQDPCLYWWGR